MRRVADIRVNHETCLAHGFCWYVAPRVFFDRDEPWPILAENLSSLLDSDRAEIIEAAVSCPVAAISLEFADGRVITSESDPNELGLRRWIDY